MVGGVIRRRVIVSGDVQGVYFRDTCRRMASAHQVQGWVRNLPDGRVEAAFEGAPSAVDQLVDWTRSGPPAALVDAVDVFEEEPEALSGFEIRSTSWPAQGHVRPQ
jgi:acylphosphatase